MQWISVEDRLPDNLGDIVMVKRRNGGEVKCYYHFDSMIWLRWYGISTSHFQDFETNNFLFDVTHWKNVADKKGCACV